MRYFCTIMVSSTCIQCIESYTIKVYSKKDEKTTLTLLSRVSPLTSFLLSHMSPLRRFYVKKAKTSTPPSYSNFCCRSVQHLAHVCTVNVVLSTFVLTSCIRPVLFSSRYVTLLSSSADDFSELPNNASSSPHLFSIPG